MTRAPAGTQPWPPPPTEPTHNLFRVTGVLGLLNCMMFPALWATADTVNQHWEEWTPLPPPMRRSLIAKATTDPDHPWIQKRNLGSNVHALIAGQKPDPRDKTLLDPEPYLDAARDYWKQHIKTVLHQEDRIGNPTAGYTGTPDVIYVGFDGRTTLDDWKSGTVMQSSNRPYGFPELQATAYANAEFIVHPDGKITEMPAIHAANIVQLNDDGTWSRHPVQLENPAAYDAFKALVEIKKYATFTQTDIIGGTPETGSAT